ncbi:peptidase MA family metallohydrolase [Kyrpidia tusciae]|uniref:Peptidase MA-like domain-containing protein n=1 Tax=Kyrpidia tusciae (strain DSM 2912 / NBRC 15312 / T2) TaxID=562970 RepID=D5WTL1_KYRT2|nr:hypothetical protein [Kyrpidia tusciae]ADG07247.1 hypothetical protein Btus_2590 [Kyrpidia tusciae DSM 2912]
MKGLWLGGIILLLGPFQQVAVNLNNVQVPPAVAQVVQHIEDVAQQVDETWTTISNMLESGQATPDQINQQLDQLSQELNQLHQALVDQSLARQIGIHRLPPERAGSPQSVSGINIIPGDARVSRGALQAAADLVKNVSLPILKNELGQQPQKAQIVLFSTPRSYGNALARAGVDPNLIPQMVDHTGGVTVGSDIWVPLYPVQAESDLANVLTHELTHVTLNEMGIGDELPVWINEGIAWYDGTQAQAQLDPQKVIAQDEAMIQQLRAVARRGALLPLSAGEGQIIQAPYNVEWQDYLAVRQLLKDGGMEKFRSFLQNAAAKGVDQSFRDHYQIDLAQYENQVESALVAALQG